MRHLQTYEKYNINIIMNYINERLYNYSLDEKYDVCIVDKDGTIWWGFDKNKFSYNILIDFINNIPESHFDKSIFMPIYDEFSKIINTEEFKNLVESEELGLL